MHLYRYFFVGGENAKYLNKLCIETGYVDSDDVTYWCKDYLETHIVRYSTMELKTSHDLKEIKEGVNGTVRFALKFFGLRGLTRRNRFIIDGIANAIYVNKDLIVECDAFDDVEDFHTYFNYCGNVFVDTSEEEEEKEENENGSEVER